MRLEVGNIFINDIQFAAETKVDKGVLYVNKEELAELLKEDEHIASVEFFIAKPGDSTGYRGYVGSGSGVHTVFKDL